MSLLARPLLLGAIAALAFVHATGCSTTRTSVTQLWQAPSPSAGPMRSVIVFGARTDEANRRVIEDGFVDELAEHAVQGVPSYKIFPDKLPDQKEARERVKNLGFDGIFVASLKDVREHQSYVPGTYTAGFWSGYYGPGWGYGNPGYVVSDEIVTFETTLWDTRAEDKLVWAALTKTKNPSSGRDFVESLTGAVLPKLEQARFIPPERHD